MLAVTGQGDVAGRLVETAARDIYRSWWEGDGPDESASWENLPADDFDRLAAVKSATTALAAVLPLLADEIWNDTRWRAGVFDDGLARAAALLRDLAVRVAR